MDLTSDWSLSNARVCLAACVRAYREQTIETEHSHVLVEPCSNAVILAFRGSADIEQWLADAEFWMTDTQFGRVHEGFWKSTQEALKVFYGCNPNGPLFITGHSLGGAQAVIFARCCGLQVSGVYTFGQPKSGDHVWRVNYIKSGLDEITWRVVNALDIVPRMPSRWLGYRKAEMDVLMPASGCLVFNPSRVRRRLADLRAVWSDWHNRRVGLVADHFIANYQQRLGIGSS